MSADDKKNTTYYDILKIQPGATNREVRDAYLTLARIYHPDTNPGSKAKIATLRFKLINEAYRTLKTEEGREHYEQQIKLYCINNEKPVITKKTSDDLMTVSTEGTKKGNAVNTKPWLRPCFDYMPKNRKKEEPQNGR